MLSSGALSSVIVVGAGLCVSICVKENITYLVRGWRSWVINLLGDPTYLCSQLVEVCVALVSHCLDTLIRGACSEHRACRI